MTSEVFEMTTLCRLVVVRLSFWWGIDLDLDEVDAIQVVSSQIRNDKYNRVREEERGPQKCQS